MKPEVLDLFRAVADLDPAARARYLTERGVDENTRRELEELLLFDVQSREALSEIVSAAAKAAFLGDAIGLRCGAFQLVNVLGAGGMGVVYLAERVDGEVRQRAAVKLMHPGSRESDRERFLREREILAGLSHPNIAHLLDAGRLAGERPYLVMEYVDGKPIDEYCEGYPTRKTIELFLKVCRAVSYLHSHAIVHRDLKPTNILVTPAGEPKILDFGIAKMLPADITVTQARMLTPDYASPEQLRGDSIGHASDIYSLGAVLRRLLTGKRPGEPSVELKGDLDRVLQRATQREPAERYGSVDEFAEDLTAFLELRPIRARRSDTAYRAAQFVRRHWVSAALSGALVVALAGMGLVWLSSRTPPSPPDLTPRRLSANTPELPVGSAVISPDGKAVAYSDSLGIHLYNLESGQTRLLPGTGGHVLVQWSPDGSGVHTWAPREQEPPAAMVIPVGGGEPAVLHGDGGFRTSPDGKRRAAIRSDGRGVLLEDSTRENPRQIAPAAGSVITDFAWSPDSTRIALLSAFPDASTVETVEVSGSGRQILIAPEKNRFIDGLAWPSQKRVIVAVQEQARGVNSVGTSNLWELLLGPGAKPVSGGLRKLTSWTDFPIRQASLSTDGTRLVFVRSFRQRDVYVADFDPFRIRMGSPRRLTLDLGDDYPTAWTPDGRAVIYTSDRNGPSAIFVQGTEEAIGRQLVFGPSSQIIARVTPDGNSVLFCGRHQGNRGVIRAPVAGGPAEFLFEAGPVIGLRCSVAGPCILAERHDGAVVVSKVDPVKGLRGRQIYRDLTDEYRAPDISPDGKWLATPSGARVTLRSLATGAVVREIAVEPGGSAARLVSLDYAPNGRGFFVGQTTQTESRLLYVDLLGKAAVLWRQAGSSAVWTIPSPDARRLALMIYTDDSNVYLMDHF